MSSFDLTVPSGWLRLDPRDPDPATLERLASPQARGVSRPDWDAVGAALIGQLQQMCASLAESGSLIVLMPDPTNALALWQPVISLGPITWGEGVEPMAVMAGLTANDPSAHVYPLDVAVAVRTHASTTVPTTDVVSAASRLGVSNPGGLIGRDAEAELLITREQFRYVIGIPSDAQAWVEATCVATVPRLPDQPDPMPMLQELFDDLLASFEWTP